MFSPGVGAALHHAGLPADLPGGEHQVAASGGLPPRQLQRRQPLHLADGDRTPGQAGHAATACSLPLWMLRNTEFSERLLQRFLKNNLF